MSSTSCSPLCVCYTPTLPPPSRSDGNVHTYTAASFPLRWKCTHLHCRLLPAQMEMYTPPLPPPSCSDGNVHTYTAASIPLRWKCTHLHCRLHPAQMEMYTPPLPPPSRSDGNVDNVPTKGKLGFAPRRYACDCHLGS